MFRFVKDQGSSRARIEIWKQIRRSIFIKTRDLIFLKE